MSSSLTTTVWSQSTVAMPLKSPPPPPNASRTKRNKRKRLASGELGLDLYKFREKLAALGLEYR